METSPKRFARVIMDRWFKRTFGWAPAKRLMTLFLTELIPERKIIDLSFGPQEHINPIEEGKDARVDVECTDQDGNKFSFSLPLHLKVTPPVLPAVSTDGADQKQEAKTPPVVWALAGGCGFLLVLLLTQGTLLRRKLHLLEEAKL